MNGNIRKTNFTIKIEVPSKAAKEYRKLSVEMKKASFVPVAGNFGQRKASFSYRGRLPIVDLINKVALIMSKTGEQYAFTVMKSKGKYIKPARNAHQSKQLQRPVKASERETSL